MGSGLVRPKEDGLELMEQLWQQVFLDGSSESSLNLRDGEGSPQTAEASVNIPEWEPNWMNFSETYNEGGPLDNISGEQVSDPLFGRLSMISVIRVSYLLNWFVLECKIFVTFKCTKLSKLGLAVYVRFELDAWEKMPISLKLRHSN